MQNSNTPVFDKFLAELRKERRDGLITKQERIELADFLEELHGKLRVAAEESVTKDNQIIQLEHKVSVLEKRLALRIVK